MGELYDKDTIKRSLEEGIKSMQKLKAEKEEEKKQINAELKKLEKSYSAIIGKKKGKEAKGKKANIQEEIGSAMEKEANKR